MPTQCHDLFGPSLCCELGFSTSSLIDPSSSSSSSSSIGLSLSLPSFLHKDDGKALYGFLGAHHHHALPQSLHHLWPNTEGRQEAAATKLSDDGAARRS